MKQKCDVPRKVLEQAFKDAGNHPEVRDLIRNIMNPQPFWEEYPVGVSIAQAILKGDYGLICESWEKKVREMFDIPVKHLYFPFHGNMEGVNNGTRLSKSPYTALGSVRNYEDGKYYGKCIVADAGLWEIETFRTLDLDGNAIVGVAFKNKTLL